MKSVIGKKKIYLQKKSSCMLNNERIENNISNGLNNYFVSVDFTLASKINDNSCDPLDYIQSNVQSMAIPNYNENNNNNNCLKSNIQCIEIRVQWTVFKMMSHM